MTFGSALGATALAYVGADAALDRGWDPYPLLVRPLLMRLEAERAHAFAIWCASHGWMPRAPVHRRGSAAEPSWDRGRPAMLHSVVWHRPFLTPIGLAAGFDKDAEAVDAMLGAGFGFVEVGSVTPRPQPGNARPRLFRLLPDRAIINRMGFNSAGAKVVAQRLAARQEDERHQPHSETSWRRWRPPWHPGIVGVNLGKNRDTAPEQAVDDYLAGLRLLGPYADYVVVNVSSPNTPGLRDMQAQHTLRQLLQRVKEERDRMSWLSHRFGKPPLLVKVSPDLSEAEMRGIAEVVLQVGIDGIVVGNTSVRRPASLQSPPALVDEPGGLSGPPIAEWSTQALRRFYRLTGGKVPLVGVGGISSGADAYAKIRAGASLVQLYTALVYDGPFLVQRMERELEECLERDGFRHISEAVGADHR